MEFIFREKNRKEKRIKENTWILNQEIEGIR